MMKTKYRGLEKRVFKSGTIRWRVKASLHGRRIFLGAFDNPVDAALKYDEFFITHFLNFPARCGVEAQDRTDFRGVRWDARHQSWVASCGRRSYLGRFDTPSQAAIAYDEAAKRKFLNFPEHWGDSRSLNVFTNGVRSRIAKTERSKRPNKQHPLFPSAPIYKLQKLYQAMAKESMMYA